MLTATRLIRQSHGPAARVPILALTANVLPEQIASFRSAGVDGHIGKPFDYEKLCSTVVCWLGDSGHAVTAPAAAEVAPELMPELPSVACLSRL